MPNAVLQRLAEERDETNRNIDRILDVANEEERDPSESERQLIVRYRDRLNELEPQIVELLDLEETRSTARDARETLGRSRREDPPQPGQPNPDDPDGGDGDQAGQYRTFAQYARDAILVRHSNVAASVERPVFERAERRMQRVVSQVLTSDIPGIVPTQHIAQIMDTIDASRPLVDASTKSALTSGKIAFPQITERPVVGKQAAEKTTAGDGSMTVTMVEKLAATFLSAANFSWQSIQWSNPDALALWFDLAAADYARKTDAEVGAMLAALDSAPTVVASPDLEGWMAAVAEAAYHVYNQTGRYADTIAADPETGYKLLGLVGTSSPVFLATGPANLANGTFPTIGGLRFIISAGLPTQTAIVGDFDAVLVAETPGAPVELRAVEPSIGGLEVGIIGSFACAVADAEAFCELTAPTPVP